MFTYCSIKKILILYICQVCVESLLLFKPATRANHLSKHAVCSLPHKSLTRVLHLLADRRQFDVGSVSECRAGRVCQYMLVENHELHLLTTVTF